jgi:hypothetical protein
MLRELAMKMQEFLDSLSRTAPPPGLAPPVEALWWDARGEWARAHARIDNLETPEAMAVHAYLHRKEGEAWNAEYWYRRGGEQYRRVILEDEWKALVEGLLG